MTSTLKRLFSFIPILSKGQSERMARLPIVKFHYDMEWIEESVPRKIFHAKQNETNEEPNYLL